MRAILTLIKSISFPYIFSKLHSSGSCKRKLPVPQHGSRMVSADWKFNLLIIFFTIEVGVK